MVLGSRRKQFTYHVSIQLKKIIVQEGLPRLQTRETRSHKKRERIVEEKWGMGNGVGPACMDDN